MNTTLELADTYAAISTYRTKIETLQTLADRQFTNHIEAWLRELLSKNPNLTRIGASSGMGSTSLDVTTSDGVEHLIIHRATDYNPDGLLRSIARAFEELCDNHITRIGDTNPHAWVDFSRTITVDRKS